MTVSAIFSAVFSAFAYYRSSSYLTKCEGIEGKCIHINRIDRIVEEEWLHKQVEGLLSDPGRVWCDYHDYHI